MYTHRTSSGNAGTHRLTSLIGRVAISTPATIAEGFKKKTKADKINYMNIALGSVEGY